MILEVASEIQTHAHAAKTGVSTDSCPCSHEPQIQESTQRQSDDRRLRQELSQLPLPESCAIIYSTAMQVCLLLGHKISAVVLKTWEMTVVVSLSGKIL